MNFIESARSDACLRAMEAECGSTCTNMSILKVTVLILPTLKFTVFKTYFSLYRFETLNDETGI